MSELTLLIFRLGFLVALWVFVFFVVYAVRSDLFGQRVRKLPAPTVPSVAPEASAFLTSAQPVLAQRPSSSASGILTLVVTSGPKHGESLPLTGADITIGRSSDSSIVIRDDYTSTRHALLEKSGNEWLISDLGSTNGTFLNGQRVTNPVVVPMNTPIAVGASTFEIRG